MSGTPRTTVRGRGSAIEPPNRFETVHREEDFEHREHDEELHCAEPTIRTEFLPDRTKTIVSHNDSPDVGFRNSLNPYRGCEHGCVYCYARPTHEYLGWNGGLDFETKILVKERAPELFRDWLAREDRHPEPIAFSGVTDCYQPAERRFRLTRRCLEVALEARQPVSIVTKNALVTRDLALLREMAGRRIVHVSMSVTTLDEALARSMEPRTSPPRSRLDAIRQLTEAGVPTRVMVAPIIPGLNDSEIPSILQAAGDAGAQSAAFVLLRLPWSVRPVFLDWLQRTRPTAKPRVESRIRSTRSGKLNETQFGSRMRGSGQIAEQIESTFRVFTKKYGLSQPLSPLDSSQFRPPKPSSGQLRLF